MVPMVHHVAFGTRDQLISCCFLCFFFGTGDENWCKDSHPVGGALYTEAEVLGAESECSSEAGLRITSMRRTFKLASWSLKSFSNFLGFEVPANLAVVFSVRFP